MAKWDKEIREVLRGRTILLEDGRFASLGPDDYVMPTGITDGATAVRLFGVMRRAKVLETSLPEWKLKDVIRKAMQDTGRGLVLQRQPETIACYLRYVLTRPAVLTFAYKDELPVLTAWTGKGLTGFISLSRALGSFKKHLPDTVEFSDTAAPDERKEEKERKKQEKLQKKQERAEKKAQKKKEAEEKKAEAIKEKEAAEKEREAAARESAEAAAEKAEEAAQAAAEDDIEAGGTVK